MLSNAYFLAKFRFDTAENELAKNLQNFVNLRKFYAWGGDTFQVVPTRRGGQKHFFKKRPTLSKRTASLEESIRGHPQRRERLALVLAHIVLEKCA